jgi:succinoglycan biosynthesis protein ExoA
LFVLSLLGGAVLAIFVPIFRALLAAEILIYSIALLAVGFQNAVVKKKVYLAIGLPLAIAAMHLAWGAGLLWSMIKGIFTNGNPEKK